MRKQTKLVAVLSTAALLAVGASMSSFAATGWQEENGTWVYYDKSGDLETEKWEKSGDNWFYLNEDGEMATDVVVEYNDNYYYVDENGAMATNKWVSVENEDYDGDDDDEPVNNWYYFGSNGKAFKTSSNSSSNSATFKTINGKKYLFDDEGKMLYGWIGTDGERKTGDEDWREGWYYCGDENDGAQSLGWKYLEIVDPNYEDDIAKGTSSPNIFDDENQTRWFYFNTNGKKIVDKDAKGINGAKYSFDEDGRMNAEWVIYGATPSAEKASQGTATYSSSWRFYGDPEDGARKTKGWFQVVPDESLEVGKYNDDENAWYYSDNNGDLVAGEIKTINGKKYAFDLNGKMRSGFRLIAFEKNSAGKESTTKIAEIYANDVDDKAVALPIDTETNFKDNVNEWLAAGYKLYYFGNGDSDGALKTGKQTIDLDGDSLSFMFGKSGGNKGAAFNGEDDKKFYQGGLLLKADKDDKYAVVKKVVVTDEDTKATTTSFTLLATSDFKQETYVKTDDVPEAKDDKWKADEYYTVDNTNANKDGVYYYLVNTSGAKQTSTKDKAKDGDDNCYALKSGVIEHIYVEQ